MPNNDPLVSIGVPMYNCEQFVRQALDSLLGQTYVNLEVIISDNASSDGTQAICLEYAARDRRIRYYRNELNIGVDPNFRRLFHLSSGDYFMWAAADDIRPPNAVQNCVEALLKNERATMAHGTVLVKRSEGEDLVEVFNQMSVSGLEAAKRVRAFTKGIEHNAILYGLYRRTALATATFGNGYGRDYLLCLQMCLLGPLEYVKSPMIIYRERRAIPSDNPMYPETPITTVNLLRLPGLRRRKCWTVLLMACYYLLKIRGVDLTERIGAVVAHSLAFVARFRTRLAKEMVFQLFSPIGWLSLLFWRLARRSPSSYRLARRLQAILRV